MNSCQARISSLQRRLRTYERAHLDQLQALARKSFNFSQKQNQVSSPGATPTEHAASDDDTMPSLE
jgi:hypothetical protein